MFVSPSFLYRSSNEVIFSVLSFSQSMIDMVTSTWKHVETSNHFAWRVLCTTCYDECLEEFAVVKGKKPSTCEWWLKVFVFSLAHTCDWVKQNPSKYFRSRFRPMCRLFIFLIVRFASKRKYSGPIRVRVCAFVCACGNPWARNNKLKRKQTVWAHIRNQWWIEGGYSHILCHYIWSNAVKWTR